MSLNGPVIMNKLKQLQFLKDVVVMNKVREREIY